MPKQIKPEFAPTTRVVGPIQPATAPANPAPAAPPVAPPAEPPSTPAPTGAPQTEGLEAPPPYRVWKPEEIACCHQNNDLTNCGAAAGEPCQWQQPGMEGTYHAERVADAAAASQREGATPTEEQFDQAAWDSGLF